MLFGLKRDRVTRLLAHKINCHACSNMASIVQLLYCIFLHKIWKIYRCYMPVRSWKNCQVYVRRIVPCTLEELSGVFRKNWHVYAGWKLSHLCRKEELSHVQYVENKLLSVCKKNCHVLCMLEELLCVCQNYCHMLEYVGRTVKLISQKIVACMLEELSRVCRKKFHMYVGKISRVCLKKLSRVCHEYLGRIVTCSAGPCISSPKSLGTPALPRGRQPSLTSQEPVLNKLYSVFVFVIYRLPHC